MKRPTARKALTWILAALTLGLAILLIRSQFELASVKKDIRFAREIMDSFDGRRERALRLSPTGAIDILYELQIPPGSVPFRNAVADLIESARIGAQREIMAYLRFKTGRNMADNPGLWIQEYGSESTKRAQADLMEAK